MLSRFSPKTKFFVIFLTVLGIANIAWSIHHIRTVQTIAKLSSTAGYSATEVITLVNQQRISEHIDPLQQDLQLMAAAQEKAEDLANRHYFAHHLYEEDTFKFIRPAGYDYVLAGENLATCFTNANEMVSAWMLSGGHRANIMNKEFEHTGVGIAVGHETEGKECVIVVQEFGKLRRPKRIEGKASYYDYSLPGSPNYSKSALTAAARDFPRGSEVEVCTVSTLTDIERTGELPKCVTVRINDYGPHGTTHPDRVIDLSSAAFKELAPLSKGVIEVTVTEIKK